MRKNKGTIVGGCLVLLVIDDVDVVVVADDGEVSIKQWAVEGLI